MELHFIADGGCGHLSESDRKAIRSHVMKGKNLGRWRSLGSRPRQKQLKQLEEHRNVVSRVARTPSRSAPEFANSPTQPVPLLPAPRQVGSAVSTMSLADSVEPKIFEIVLRFSSIAKQILFSIEPCIFFERRVEHWVAPLAIDAAYLHANISHSLYYHDVVLSLATSRESRRTWYYHHTKALGLIRDRINSDKGDSRLSSRTISVILILASQAFITGDLETARKHLNGISIIVNLRGGFSIFEREGNEKLATEILRCDLGLAVHSGTKSLLFPKLADEWPYPSLSVFLDHNSRNLNVGLQLAQMTDMFYHDGLTSIWNTMSDFCSVINCAAISEQRITMKLFLNSMASIMYRLIDMQIEPSSISEVIRLGLLCSCCSVFLQWQHLGISYTHLSFSVKRLFLELNGKDIFVSQEFAFWLFIIASISVLSDSDADWLHPLLRQVAGTLELQTWDQARKLLSTIMWIDSVHGNAGKRVFEAAILHVC
ncbi:hypothetical protein F5B22DRAFT_624274 [Xylaria bambusicola]|uniref:uncharacterized protein n=1 Tax=Xylaria bambusicola TaxID=326684 RepID=UPI002007815B|nr:uncharacterized protein F5B22DRAFT_624274 [Xylaria bambusicola]KAI0506272.1 hypothetical protein F5B22DRAFT_624274 [Xylaria bambusicola]